MLEAAGDKEDAATDAKIDGYLKQRTGLHDRLEYSQDIDEKSRRTLRPLATRSMSLGASAAVRYSSCNQRSANLLVKDYRALLRAGWKLSLQKEKGAKRPSLSSMARRSAASARLPATGS